VYADPDNDNARIGALRTVQAADKMIAGMFDIPTEASRHEHTGEGGGPVEVKHDAYGELLEQIGENEQALDALAELDRAVADGSEDTGGAGDGVDE